MNLFSDEQLSAFIDNELPEQDMQNIRAALASSSELQQRVAQLQQADNMAQLFFSQQDDTPLPESLLDLIHNHQPDEAEAVVESNLAELPKRKKQPSVLTPFWGIAASVLFASVIAWQFLMPSTPTTTALDQELLSLNSGSVQTINENTRLEVRWSELNNHNEFCRYFILHTPSSSMAQSACWQGERWHYQATNSINEYQPANATNAQAPANALSAEEESRWLEQLSQP